MRADDIINIFAVRMSTETMANHAYCLAFLKTFAEMIERKNILADDELLRALQKPMR